MAPVSVRCRRTIGLSRSSARLHREQEMLNGERHGMRSVRGLQLLHGRAHVEIDGSLADPENASDLRGGLAARHPLKNFALARGEHLRGSKAHNSFGHSGIQWQVQVLDISTGNERCRGHCPIPTKQVIHSSRLWVRPRPPQPMRSLYRQKLSKTPLLRMAVSSELKLR
jgi:hypothetical protein